MIAARRSPVVAAIASLVAAVTRARRLEYVGTTPLSIAFLSSGALPRTHAWWNPTRPRRFAWRAALAGVGLGATFCSSRRRARWRRVGRCVLRGCAGSSERPARGTQIRGLDGGGVAAVVGPAALWLSAKGLLGTCLHLCTELHPPRRADPRLADASAQRLSDNKIFGTRSLCAADNHRRSWGDRLGGQATETFCPRLDVRRHRAAVRCRDFLGVSQQDIRPSRSKRRSSRSSTLASARFCLGLHRTLRFWNDRAIPIRSTARWCRGWVSRAPTRRRCPGQRSSHDLPSPGRRLVGGGARNREPPIRVRCRRRPSLPSSWDHPVELLEA